MAGTGTKRITELTEASNIQSGDFIAVDSNARGTKKVSTDTLATSAALTDETNARAGADEQMSERMDGIEEQTALIQNPTKTVSGALCSFTDGADMPMVACTASITPKQSGTGTPSPSNVRPISGWESVSVYVSGKNFLENTGTSTTASGVTLTVNSDKSITVSGTATATVWFNINYHFNLSKGTFILSGGDEFYSANAGSPVSYLDFRNNAGGIYNNIRSTIAETRFTLTESVEDFRISLNVISGKTANYTIYPMIRRADDTDPTYEPYQGNTTTTPLGRTVYGGTLDVVSGELTAYPFYPSYNGETLNGRWVCDRAVYAEGTTPPTGSQVALISGTGTTYTLTPTEVKTLLGENNVWADSGDVEITYRRDISIVINNLESALNG